MKFLKQMKTRERVELLLKTISAVIVGIVLIFLLEGMIYKLYITKINENNSTQIFPDRCIAYCEKVAEDRYKIYLHDLSNNSWSVRIPNFTQEEINNTNYLQIIYHKPNAFDVSINKYHYIVMAVFILSIVGFYCWRFYKLDSDYKTLEKRLKLNGSIF